MSSIKAVFRYLKEEDRNKFIQSRCLITISVGQEVHESEKFAVTIDLVNKSFKSCILLVDDTLQRHTMALDSDKNAQYFYEKSLLEGDLWLERNEKYFSKLSALERVIRWDSWITHPNFKLHQEKIESLIDSDPSYKMSFDNTINEFLTRYWARRDHATIEHKARAYQLCFNYLMEECVAMCLWPQLSCHYEVYPSPRNEIMAETHARFVTPLYPDLLFPVAIKFKNRKKLRPQCFDSKNLLPNFISGH